jgi:hypothetical protein
VRRQLLIGRAGVTQSSACHAPSSSARWQSKLVADRPVECDLRPRHSDKLGFMRRLMPCSCIRTVSRLRTMPPEREVFPTSPYVLAHFEKQAVIDGYERILLDLSGGQRRGAPAEGRA